MHSVRSQARRHAYNYTSSPVLSKSSTKTSEPGGLNEKQDGRVTASQPKAGDGLRDGGHNVGAGDRDHSGKDETTTHNTAEDAISQSTPPPAPPPNKSEDARTGDSALVARANQKPSITKRMKAGSKRFLVHMREAIFHSWINVLLIFVPVGIIVEAIGASPAIIFAMNAVAIVPLAGLLSHATESVAERLGDTLGALLNVSFGNAVELIIFIIALVKREIGIVQASLLGSILANLLLILGMAFLLGGLRYREQVYNSTVTQMSACLLSLAVMSLLLPTAFHASFNTDSANEADDQVLKVSRGTSVVLLLVYALYLLFQLKSHAHMYESTPQQIIDEESHPGVLADLMDSSSSDSSSSSSSDSDTSASVTTAGRKIKRAFTHRRRRKSSASTSIATDSIDNSALSSPLGNDNRTSYLNGEDGGARLFQDQTAATAVANEADADADQEDNSGNGPRVKDFGTGDRHSEFKGSKKHRKGRSKKERKKQRKDERKKSKSDHEVAVADDEVEQPSQVQFSDSVQVAENTGANAKAGRSPFGGRLASRSNMHRPALPKMLSNNVFVTPPSGPAAGPPPRPAGGPRSHSSGNVLRRTSSLPDRLNQQHSNPTPRPTVPRTEALPPYSQRRVDSERTGEDSGDEDDAPKMSRTSAVVLLLCSTALVAICAEFMVDAIPAMVKPDSVVSQTFIGLIILPIVGNAAEHVTAVTVATKNKMDLAIGVAVGSSIQIALFITPFIVLLGWMMDRDMSLYFNLFETISLFVTAFVVNFLVLDGRSNYLEGSLLIAAYVIIALGAFFYPQTDNQSAVGSVGADGLGR